MNPIGRPTKYKDEYVEQAYKLCLLGHTDEELMKENTRMNSLNLKRKNQAYSKHARLQNLRSLLSQWILNWKTSLDVWLCTNALTKIS